jgi:hypothetical protein
MQDNLKLLGFLFRKSVSGRRMYFARIGVINGKGVSVGDGVIRLQRERQLDYTGPFLERMLAKIYEAGEMAMD